MNFRLLYYFFFITFSDIFFMNKSVEKPTPTVGCCYWYCLSRKTPEPRNVSLLILPQGPHTGFCFNPWMMML